VNNDNDNQFDGKTANSDGFGDKNLSNRNKNEIFVDEIVVKT